MAKSSAKNSTAQLTEHLSRVLADTYALLIKTHGYHWNVTGPLFPQLHTLFETQYNELFLAVDEIAERIRAIDATALGSLAQFQEKTVVKDSPATPPASAAMVKDLIKTNEAVRARIVEACDLAGELGDKGSEDAMIIRIKVHDKAIWMLKAQAA